jgi:hypothetical protein
VEKTTFQPSFADRLIYGSIIPLICSRAYAPLLEGSRLLFLSVGGGGLSDMLLGKNHIGMTEMAMNTAQRANPNHQHPIHIGSFGVPSASVKERNKINGILPCVVMYVVEFRSITSIRSTAKHKCNPYLPMGSLETEVPQPRVEVQ